jgi:hypothetical protein
MWEVKLGKERRGIIEYRYLEYQSVCPIDEIGSPPPPPSECVSPLDPRGESNTILRVRGWGGPNSDDWKKAGTLYTLCVTCFFNNMGMAYLCKFGAAWAGGGLGVGLNRKLRDDTVIHMCS